MKKVILFFCFLIIVKASAQKYELGKVTKEELGEKFYIKDSSAPAAILFKKAKTRFIYSDKKGFESKTEFSIKIKIYKKEGLKWANFEIPYYVGYETLDKEAVVILKAYTYNLVNGKIEKEKVSE